jgi:hypothetical protein
MIETCTADVGMTDERLAFLVSRLKNAPKTAMVREWIANSKAGFKAISKKAKTSSTNRGNFAGIYVPKLKRASRKQKRRYSNVRSQTLPDKSEEQEVDENMS